MYPDLIEIGGLRIASFGVFMALAFFTDGVVIARELRRKNENPDTAWNLVGWAVLGGVHGELPFKRRLAVQTTRGNGFANGNSPGRLPEGLGHPLSLQACRRITLGAREPRCSSF